MLPSSNMGEALTYLNNQWDRLTAYVNDGVHPYEYLKHVFTRLPNMTTKDNLEELMPWCIEIV